MSNIVHSISKSDGFASVHSPSVRLAPRAGMDNLGQTPHTIHFDRSKLGKIVTPLQEGAVGGMDVAGYSCPWNVPVGTFLGLMSSARTLENSSLYWSEICRILQMLATAPQHMRPHGSLFFIIQSPASHRFHLLQTYPSMGNSFTISDYERVEVRRDIPAQAFLYLPVTPR